MMKYLKRISLLVLLLSYHSLFSASGLLFDVLATGTPAKVSITLCLNGKGPTSCQNYTVSALDLTIRTVPKHIYSNAGIKINTPGYTLANIGVDCVLFNKGYCLFTVGNTRGKTISLTESKTYSIGGIVSGLTANGLVLQNKSGDN